MTEYQSILTKRVELRSVAFRWMKQLFINKKQPLPGMDVFSRMSIFRLYPGLKTSFEHKSVGKNLFLRARFCWVSRLISRKVDQTFKFGVAIGYEDSYFEFLFRYFEVFKLHAKINDAAGAVRAHSGKGPGDCSIFGRGQSSCSLGHVTGLLF